MEAFLGWVNEAAPAFLLILARCIGMLFQAPVIGSRVVPGMARAGLAIALAAVYWVTLAEVPKAPPTFPEMIVALVSELLFGLVIGFASSLVFFAIQGAGDYVAQAVGLTMMSTMNPLLRTQTTATGQLFYYLGLTVFVLVGGHVFFLGAFYQSFELVPLGGFVFTKAVWGVLAQMTAGFLMIVAQMAMPAVMVIFMVDLGLGIINRSTPSISNILDMVMALKPPVGIAIVALMIPNTVALTHQLADQMIREVGAVVQAATRR